MSSRIRITADNFVAKGFIDIGADLDAPFAPPSVRAIAQTVEAVQADAAHLFASLHRENPYAKDAPRTRP